MKLTITIVVLLASYQHVDSLLGMSSSAYSRLKYMLDSMNGNGVKGSPAPDPSPPPPVASPPPPPPSGVMGSPAPTTTVPGTSVFGQPKTVVINIPVTFKKSLGGMITVPGSGVMGSPAPTPSPPPPLPTPSPTPSPSPPPANDGCVFGVLTSTPELSRWATLVALAGRSDDLSDPENEITLFAPTNAAFTTSGITTEQFMALMEDANSETLQMLVDQHLILDMEVIIMGDAFSVSVPSAQGTQLLITSISIGNSQVQVAGSSLPPSNIITANIQPDGCNGVLHIIDRVLL